MRLALWPALFLCAFLPSPALAEGEDGPKSTTNASASRFSDADYERHIEALKKRLPGDGFTIVIQKPFVVVGDEAPKTVRSRASGTVKWAIDRLKAKYFTEDPLAIVDIWLFKDKQSYRKHVKKLFGEFPGTPFGYYTPTHEALVMNIATGGGTLVHEIVHPFMRANFEDCPAWFNEGLASLYEQCGDRDGEIKGFTNWRLPALQRAIERDDVPTFKKLLATTEHAFYNRDRGTNYAQARYLCYYLQERGLLAAFYERFLETRKSDPTGYAALAHVLKVEDVDVFQKKVWEPYTLGLRYR